VDRKSRREKDETTLSLLINRKGEDMIPTLDAQTIGRAKLFLTNLIPDIEEANLELEIKAQDELVVKAEKRLKDLQDEKSDLEKKLQKNASELEKQQKEIESQRATLDALKGRRKTAETEN
jgi:chromosome segregation ATPase